MLVLAGCGRFGFEARDAPSDVTTSSLAPQSRQVATFSTNSATFVDIPGATLTIPASPDTRWVLLTSARLESSVSTGITVEARYTVDGIERGIGGTESSAPSRPGPWQHVHVIDGDDSEHVVTYQLRDALAATSTIHALSMIAVPLPATAVSYAALDDIQAVTSGTSAPHTTLSLGALRGDYIFLLLVNGSDAPGESDLFTEWFGPSGEPWMTTTHFPREPWQSLFTMHRATVDSPNVMLTLNAWRGANPSQIRNVRAVALRADAFASAELARDDRSLVTTSMPAMPGVELAPLPATADTQYVLVGSIRLEEDCTVAPDAERAAHVVIDDVTATHIHATDNCAYAITYGAVRLLDTKPTYLAMGFSTLNGNPIIYDGAQVLLLALP